MYVLDSKSKHQTNRRIYSDSRSESAINQVNCPFILIACSKRMRYVMCRCDYWSVVV